MKLRSDLRLRKIGNRYMIVQPVGEGARQTNVFELNGTAAQLWQQIGDGEIHEEELADYLCSQYEIDRPTALSDVRKQIDEWRTFGLIV